MISDNADSTVLSNSSYAKKRKISMNYGDDAKIFTGKWMHCAYQRCAKVF